jgi:hypothetical protein
MGEHGRESALIRGTIWPQIGVQGGRLDAAVQARLARNSRRFSVSLLVGHSSGDWRIACGNCGNFSDGAAICTFTSVVPCTALIGVTLAGIAEIRRGLHVASAHEAGRAYPNVHGAAFRRVMTAFLLES